MNKYDELFFAQYASKGVEILYVCHRHVVLIVDRLLLTFFFFVFIPSFFYYYDSLGFATIPFVYFEAYLVIVYLTLIYAVLDWYNDVWLITDSGIVDVDWKFFSGKVSYLDYRGIHGIEIQRNSVMDSMLGKGDIEIHLQDESQEFRLTDAAHPDDIVDYIHSVITDLKSRLHDDKKGDHEGEPFEVLMATLTEMVKEHLESRGQTFSKEEDEATAEVVKKVMRRKSTIDLTADGHES